MPKDAPRNLEDHLRRQQQYRGHKVEVYLNDHEYSVLEAEAARRGRPRGALLREIFLLAMATDEESSDGH